MSAGNASSSKTLIISPGLNFPELVFSNVLPFLRMSTGALLISKSDLNLTNSSTPSQIIETTRTKTRGRIEVAGFVGAIYGILAHIAAAKKYTFANLLN